MNNPSDADIRKWAKTFNSPEPHKFPGGLEGTLSKAVCLRLIDAVRAEAIKKYNSRRVSQDPNYRPNSAQYEAVRKDVAAVLEKYQPHSSMRGYANVYDNE